MSFFYNEKRSQAKKRIQSEKPSFEFPPERIKELGCKVCPLNKEEGRMCSPKMKSSGSSNPLFYVLGEAPGEKEDELGEAFVGKSGKLLRKFLTKSIVKKCRFHNVIRCHPEGNRDPTPIEVQACKGHIEDDIAKFKPLVIIGTGNIPLSWAIDRAGISYWKGRLFPVKVKDHLCWFYPIYHPSYVLRKQRKNSRTGESYPSEYDHIFKLNIEHIVDLVMENNLPEMNYYDSGYSDGIQVIEGESSRDLNLLEDSLNRISSYPDIGLDLETVGFRPYPNKGIIVSCAVGTFNDTVAFPMDHPGAWNSSLRRKVIGLLGEFLLYSGQKIAHNEVFEYEWLAYYYGYENLRKTEWGDTMAQAYAINEEVGGGLLSLDYLCLLYFGFRLKLLTDIDFDRILELPIKDVLLYNGMDTKWTHRLFQLQEEVVESHNDFVYEYNRQLELIPTLAGAQLKGLVPDHDAVLSLSEGFTSKIEKTKRKMNRTPEVQEYITKYGEFNPGSPDHVVTILKDILKRKECKKGEGKYSSDEGVLNSLPAREVPLAPLVLEYRSLAKMKSTYIDPFNVSIPEGGKHIHDDGLIHTNYNSMLTGTGRLSSDEPNSQNFPKHKHKECRKVVRAPEGFKLVAADYGAIEARAIAMASKDRNLVEAFWTHYDIHMDWGNRIAIMYPEIFRRLKREFEYANESEAALLKVLRQEAKNKWVFPQFFGASFYSCSENLEIPSNVAEKLQNDFFRKFPGVKKWHDKVRAFYKKHGYVTTLGGRRRHGPLTDNMIINAPIQGTASDIVTKAMSILSVHSVELEKPQYQSVLNVHDDLSFYIPDESLDEDINHIARVMCTVDFKYINVPLLVEVETGDNWYNLKEYKEFETTQFEINND